LTRSYPNISHHHISSVPTQSVPNQLPTLRLHSVPILVPVQSSIVGLMTKIGECPTLGVCKVANELSILLSQSPSSNNILPCLCTSFVSVSCSAVLLPQVVGKPHARALLREWLKLVVDLVVRTLFPQSTYSNTVLGIISQEGGTESMSFEPMIKLLQSISRQF
jgi:hypothetical protein